MFYPPMSLDHGVVWAYVYNRAWRGVREGDPWSLYVRDRQLALTKYAAGGHISAVDRCGTQIVSAWDRCFSALRLSDTDKPLTRFEVDPWAKASTLHSWIAPTASAAHKDAAASDILLFQPIKMIADLGQLPKAEAKAKDAQGHVFKFKQGRWV